MAARRSNQNDYTTQETKQLIIYTSQKLFMTYGYRSVTTRQIAEACDVTQPALYYHFPNKQMIYIEVVRSIMDRTRAALHHINEHQISFRDRLFQISMYMLTNHQEDLSQMFHDIEHEMNEESQGLIRKWWLDSYLHPVVAMIEDAVKRREIRELDTLNSSVMEMAYFILDLMKSFLQTSIYRISSEAERKREAERKSNLIVTIIIEGLSG
ncbi:TetR/AcrR family transcriptional regulator [Neobacillus sp. NPDC093127]|uniref:TetR/AcrR family transcriptional regulator n=1 Tax=Neobacillus sp. NPDC093127 TaxID=3364296 RepID=UPI0038072F98